MKKIIFLIGVAISALMMASCSGTSGQEGFVKVQGQILVNPDGSEFHITGTNLGNWLNPEGYMFRFPGHVNSAHFINEALCQLVGPQYMENFWKEFVSRYVMEEDIAFIAASGATTIRLPFHYRIFTGDGYLGMRDPEDGFRAIDNVVAWCRQYGLKIILDMHDCPGGQTGDNIDDSYGYAWLFTEKEAQDQFVSIWESIAERYADEPVILGYDFMNEPISSRLADKDELNALLQPLMIRVSEAVRKIDPNHIFFIGGAQWNGNFSMFDNYTFDSNMAWTCHTYQCSPQVKSLLRFTSVREKTGLPMYMGETGENTDEWVMNMRMALDSVNIGWTFWPYKKLASSSSFVSAEMPEGWKTVCEFLAADRSSYSKIAAARPDQAAARRTLDAYLDNILFGKCNVNGGYINALGLEY